MRPRYLALLGLLLTTPCLALDYRGDLGLELWGFARPAAQQQAQTNAALRLKTEFWHDLNDRHDTFTLTPFVRLDAEDSQRSHADLREASWVHLDEGYELRSGIRQVFWGVTEGAHLVDIINQTDQVESLDGEQKLGQPMLNLAFERGEQMLDLFLLLGARERSFPGEDGRLRLPLVVDDDLTRYESSREDHRLDLALRWQWSPYPFRIGVSGFSGTAREPELQPSIDASRLLLDGSGHPIGLQPGYQPVLAAYYPLIHQAGLDVQVTQGDLLWKLEAIRREGGLEDFQAADAGVEYSQVGVLESRMDLGWLLELLYDSRQEQASTPLQRDLLLGWRLAVNNEASSELLTSVIIDSRTQERLFSLEAKHRLSDNLLLEMEVRVFGHTPAPQSAAAFLRQPDRRHALRPLAADDFLRLQLGWFF